MHVVLYIDFFSVISMFTGFHPGRKITLSEDKEANSEIISVNLCAETLSLYQRCLNTFLENKHAGLFSVTLPSALNYSWSRSP